jgi:WD40 repeat protein
MGTMRLVTGERAGQGHAGEIYSCSFSPDASFVLSGGWDGHLRAWDTATGQPLVSLRAGPKPLSCCAFSPDGKQWVSGSMEGMLTFWDAVSHHPMQTFMAHTRPISAISYAPDGEQLATASWDRQVVLRKIGKEREGNALSGHTDIVAGCRYSLDGSHLLSWSYDRTVCVWDARAGKLIRTLTGHEDRVMAAALSPDGRWAVSGSRDGELKTWDLQTGSELASVKQVAEIRGCFCMPDGQSLATVDSDGWMVLLDAPSLQLQAELLTGIRVICGDLSPRGNQIVLGCEDGHIALVALEGFEDAPLVVTATQGARTTSNLLTRLLGQTKSVTTYNYSCPACHHTLEATQLPEGPFSCPQCQRRLRINQRVAQFQSR